MSRNTLSELQEQLNREERLENEAEAGIQAASPDIAVSLRWSAASHRERATDLRIQIARLKLPPWR